MTEKNWAGMTDEERERIIAACREFNAAMDKAFSGIFYAFAQAVEKINRIGGKRMGGKE